MTAPLFMHTPIRRLVARGAWLGCALLACTAILPATAQPGAGKPVAALPNTAAAPGAPAMAAAPKTVSKPLWRELTSRQQRALEPLASTWDELTEPHKLKWLAISRDYAKLSASEQEVLHSRMTEWARLSNQEREQARRNFATVKQVPPDERKAKWEAYQALSAEEKRKLAAGAPSARPPGAAAATRSVAEQKFAPVPALAKDGQRQPRIQLAPAAAPARAPAPLPVAAKAAVGAPVAAEAQALAPTSTGDNAAVPPAASAAAQMTDHPASAP